MPVVQRTDYEPPQFLRHSIAAYIWADKVRRVPKPPYESFEQVDAPVGGSGGFFELAWWRAQPNTVGDKVALIAPGLSGGAYAKPTCGMARALHEEGWDVAVWAFRDTGMVPTRVRPTYSGYGFDDLSVAVHRLSQEYDDISLVGLSLGGNMVIQYVCAYSCTPEDNPVSKAVAISPPIAFGQTVEHWSQGVIGRLAISRSALSSMKRLVSRKARNTSAVTSADAKAYKRVRTAAEADHYINSEFNGYPDTSQYWQRANTLTALRSTRTSTDLLIVLAKDDFILESHSYPHADMVSPNVTIELTMNGSHVGFVSRGWRNRRYWSEQRAVDHLSG
jgi:predicted alpha/beta-fold hydrolase